MKDKEMMLRIIRRESLRIDAYLKHLYWHENVYISSNIAHSVNEMVRENGSIQSLFKLLYFIEETEAFIVGLIYLRRFSNGIISFEKLYKGTINSIRQVKKYSYEIIGEYRSKYEEWKYKMQDSYIDKYFSIDKIDISAGGEENENRNNNDE